MHMYVVMWWWWHMVLYGWMTWHDFYMRKTVSTRTIRVLPCTIQPMFSGYFTWMVAFLQEGSGDIPTDICTHVGVYYMVGGMQDINRVLYQIRISVRIRIWGHTHRYLYTCRSVWRGCVTRQERCRVSIEYCISLGSGSGLGSGPGSELKLSQG